MKERKIYWFPKTMLGKWAVILCLGFFSLFALKGVPAPIPSQLIFTVGIAGFAAEIVAFVKKDRAIIGVFPFLLGLFIIAFIIAEIAYPH